VVEIVKKDSNVCASRRCQNLTTIYCFKGGKCRRCKMARSKFILVSYFMGPTRSTVVTIYILRCSMNGNHPTRDLV